MKIFQTILLFAVYLPILYFGLQADSYPILTWASYFILFLFFLGSAGSFLIGNRIERVLFDMMNKNEAHSIHNFAEKGFGFIQTTLFALPVTYILFINGHATTAALFLTSYLIGVYYLFKMKKTARVFSSAILLKRENDLYKIYGDKL